MARDFEDINDISDLNDTELRGLVREHLAAQNALDIAEITVRVDKGTVVLEGRVGTDGERQIADHVVSDTLGILNYRNDIFVDPLRRATNPEAADEAVAARSRTEGLLLGDRPVPMNAEVDDADDVEDATDAELYGTTDPRKAAEDGTPWIPPDSPTPEGMADGEIGENH